MSLIDLVRQNLSAADVQRISGQLGTDPATTEQAIQAALPMMVGGMAGAAQQPGGESAIQNALGGLLGGGGGLGGILGGMLGQHQSTVQDGVAKASGLDAGKAGKLLILLAPFVLRSLAKHQQQAQATAPASPGASSGGLGGILQKEAQDAMNSASSPHVGGVLGKILAGVTGG